MNRADGDDFLARWARRKTEARRSDDVPDVGPQASDPLAGEPAAEETDPRSDGEILEELGLPEPETLGRGADFRRFLVAGVPLRIRNRALRQLWRSDPRLANLDGLVDHAEDFSDRATVKPGMRTAYEVGRGVARRFAEAANSDKPDHTPAPADPEAPEEPDTTAVSPATAGSPEEAAPTAIEAPADTAPTEGRRMRFSFEKSAPTT